MRVVMQDPHHIYSQRLDERRLDLAARDQEHRVFGYLQLAAVVSALAAVGLALFHKASIFWVFAPAAAFATLFIIHERLLRVSDGRRRSIRYFERALDRLEGKWAGQGEAGDRFLDPAHPYAQDLDLFGKGSLFELLCTARTQVGIETLAEWLLHPADPDTVRSRQLAVDDLRSQVDWREELAVVADEARSGVHATALAAWGETAPLLASRRLRVLTKALALLGVPGLVAFLAYSLYIVGIVHMSERMAVLSRDFFLLVLFINGTFLFKQRRRVDLVVTAAEEAAHELKLLSEVLLRIERQSFRAPLLIALRASLDVEGEPVSKRLKRLSRLIDHLDDGEHLLIRVIEPFLLWTLRWATLVEQWRRHSGPAVRRWLAATGEIEALCSLASHAFEHPADPFPEFRSESPWLEAEAIAHPLLDENRVVRNDVRIGRALRLLVVSGSNMSGKSTLLRTLGVNTVLAQAGAPVRAKRLMLSPLAVGASIRIIDSLQGGISRFYAEILRIRQILLLTGGPLPVLFLVDEFLHGTNSHDRRIGAEALARGLVDRGAVGLITTHDLALADIVEVLGPQAANVHFEDHLDRGHMTFDYRMRPGIVRKSNAIELMRSVGLEI
jgi:hypothetical protein